MNSKHRFVILAYKESEYLEECIRSVVGQSVLNSVILATSTNNDFIEKLAEKYNLEIKENLGPKGIANDFEFALSCAEDAQYVTVAHQDDVYGRDYLENVAKRMTDESLIVFTDYAELKGAKAEKNNANLLIKRILLFPLKFDFFQDKKFFKRLSLAFGNPICCPAVTYNMQKIPRPLFEDGFGSNMDWAAWEKLSKIEGKFIYSNMPLMLHRIHSDSTTSEFIMNDRRTSEDLKIFLRFWPFPVARLLSMIYKASEKNNG
ncbi:MAG TPA: glycosyltransferase [Patescibacteria group bacterium]